MAASLGFSGSFGLVFVSICYIILLLFGGFLVAFDVVEFSLNWIFTLIAFDNKGNAVLLQTGVRFFSYVKTNYMYIIATEAHAYERIYFIDRL